MSNSMMPSKGSYLYEQINAIAPKPRRPEFAPNAITIRLPLPPSEANPNVRAHHHRKAAAIAKQRRDAATAAMVALGTNPPPLWERAIIHATFHKPSKRAKVADADNALSSLKGSIDGVADAGILSNDRGLTWLPVEQVLHGSEPAGVVVVITPL